MKNTEENENEIIEDRELAPLGMAELAAHNIVLMKHQADALTVAEDGTGYSEVRDAHVQTKRYATKVNSRLKELNDPLNEQRRKNNEMAAKLQGELKPIIETLGTKRVEWEKKEAKRKAEQEKAEAERIAKIKDKIDKMWNLPTTITGMYDSEGTMRIANELKSKEILFDSYQEFTEEAKKARDKTYLILLSVYENLKKTEAAAKETERIEAEKRKAQKVADEKARKEREALEAERVKFEAEKAEFERKKSEGLKVELSAKTVEQKPEPYDGDNCEFEQRVEPVVEPEPIKNKESEVIPEPDQPLNNKINEVVGKISFEVSVPCPHCGKQLNLNEPPYEDCEENDALGMMLFGSPAVPAQWSGINITYYCCGCKNDFILIGLEY